MDSAVQDLHIFHFCVVEHFKIIRDGMGGTSLIQKSSLKILQNQREIECQQDILKIPNFLVF